MLDGQIRMHLKKIKNRDNPLKMFTAEVLTFLVLLLTKTVICSSVKTRDGIWPVASEGLSFTTSVDHITSSNRLFPARNFIKHKSLVPVPRRRRFIDGVSQDSLESSLEESTNQESAKPINERNRYECHSQALVDDQNHEVTQCREVPCIVYLQPGKIFKRLSLTFAFDSIHSSSNYDYFSVSAEDLCINDPSRGYKIEINMREKTSILDKWTIVVNTYCANREVEKITTKTRRLNWLRNILVEAEGSSSWRKTFTHSDCLKIRLGTDSSLIEDPKPSTKAPDDNADVFTITFWPAFACLIAVILCFIAAVIMLKKCKSRKGIQISDQEQLIWTTSNNLRILQTRPTSSYDTETSLYGEVIYRVKQPDV